MVQCVQIPFQQLLQRLAHKQDISSSRNVICHAAALGIILKEQNDIDVLLLENVLSALDPERQNKSGMVVALARFTWSPRDNCIVEIRAGKPRLDISQNHMDLVMRLQIVFPQTLGNNLIVTVLLMD